MCTAGAQIGSMLNDLGIESQFVNGYRMTDEPTMSVVRMVLVGKVNQDIVSRINGQGGRAIGLSGADGLLLKGHQVSVDGQDVGRVGIIDTVDVDQLNFLASGGYMPIIAPVAVDANGSPLNVNADLAAGVIAGHLGRGAFVDDRRRRRLNAKGAVISTLKRQEISN